MQWLVFLPAVAILYQGCNNCRSDSLPMLNVVMQFQHEGEYILRGNLVETRTIRSNEVLLLPLALKADTTVYDFLDVQGQVWRLALAYDKTLNFEGPNCGFFLDFQNVKVLPESTFSDVQITANGVEWNVWVTE